MLKDRVRSLRKSKGLSQRELARLIGFNQSQVSKIEGGNRRVTEVEIKKLAKALHVSAASLLK